MNPKALLIPIAAFAVTVTGVSAFNSQVLQNAGLNDSQIAAFEIARELREEGDKEGAREVLIEAGVDEEALAKLREAMHAHKHEMHSAIDAAVATGDFEAFKNAIEGSPLADIIMTEDDFEKFVEAYNLRKDGDFEAAHEIMEDLGIEHPFGHSGHGSYGLFLGEENQTIFENLTDEQKDALKAAHEAKDREAAEAIFEEAGIEMPEHGGMHRGFRHGHEDEE